MNEPTIERLVATAKSEVVPAGAAERGWDSLASALARNAAPSVPVDVGPPVIAKVATGAAVLRIVVIAIVSAGTVIGGASLLGDRGAPSSARTDVSTRDATPAGASEASAASTPEPAFPPITAASPTAAAPQPATSSAVASPPVRPAATSSTSSGASSADALEDVQLLARAWQAIRDRRFDDAIARVDEHAARFADSALAPERQACRVIAMCERGDADAGAAAAAFLAAGSHQVHAKRVRSACDRRRTKP